MHVNLTIRRKLIASVSLFLIPIATLAALFVAQARKDMSFAGLERDGLTYLRTAWEVLYGEISSMPPSTAILSALEADRARFDEAMHTREASMELARAAEANSGAATATAARTLVAKVADGSNLTLDPDLDSFYVMDAVTVKLPDLVEQAGRLGSLASASAGKGVLSAPAAAEILIEQGKIRASADGLAASLTSAFAANGDGATRRALSPGADAVARAMQDLLAGVRDDLDAHASGRDGSAEAAALRRARAEVLSAADGLWQASAAELDRLLAARISGFGRNLALALGFAALVTAAAFLLAWSLGRSIVRALAALDGRIRQLSDMDLDAPVPEAGRRDEIGALARAVVHFRDRTIARIDDASSDERKRELVAQERRFMGQVAERISTSVGGGVAQFRQVAARMGEATQGVQARATATRERLVESVADLQGSARDMATAASAVTELASSIAEIASQTGQSMAIVRAAREEAHRATQLAARLSDASGRIGSVTTLISHIAARTNLLALNATIEAARAGDAGRGFAVVAAEVKDLAGQTMRATDDIGRQVATLEAASTDVFGAIGRIGQTVEAIDGVSASVAGAVEQQNAATSELNQTVQAVVDRTRAVIADLDALPPAATETDQLAGGLAASAGELAREADRLDGEVNRLVREIADRRAEPRRTARGRAWVRFDGGRHAASVLDVSAGGVRLGEVEAVPSAGTPLTIEFGDGSTVSGHLAWADEGTMGISVAPNRIAAEMMSRLALAQDIAA